MTENELLDLLTGVRSDYIAQTEAFRQGKIKKKRTFRLLLIAAIFAVVLPAGAAIQAFLVPNWKQGTEEPEMQSFAATAAKTETTEPEADWYSFDGGDAHSQAGPSADELLRVREREITYVDGEGNDAALETELFIGRGYSIYVPKEGWTYTQETYGGLTADKWTYDLNPEINLRIVRVMGTADRAEAWVRETESDWSFFWDEQGGLYGDRDGKVMNVNFYQKEVDTIVVLCAFPMEAYEGGGRTLSVLVDTFSRWPTEVDMLYPTE